MHLFKSSVLRHHPYRALLSRPFSSSTKPAALSEEQQMRAIFASDSTFMLVKKLLIYRMMSSNMFINHALTGMNMAYRVMGKTLTNFIINKTAGEVFTSGETLQSLNQQLS